MPEFVRDPDRCPRKCSKRGGPTVSRTYSRYVAIGDSWTEGVGDPDQSRPNGLRGWADRVAETLATRNEDFASPKGARIDAGLIAAERRSDLARTLV